MRRAIVSGVTGHLGAALARQLAAAGVEVHGLTRGDLTSESIQLHRLDGNTQTLIALFEALQPDVVFHLAGLARRTHRGDDVSPFVDANILFGTQVLEAARCAGCSNFICAGTYLQHFGARHDRPMNLYAATKQAFEVLVEYYVEAFGMSAIRLTLCDIYSEHDSRRKLMTDLAAAYAERAPLNVLNDDASVDLIHVEDAARAFLHAAQLLEDRTIPAQELARFSVSSGSDASVWDLIAAFERIGGREIIVRRLDPPRMARDMKPWRGAPLPGWTPRIPLEDGIARMIARHR